ncbi:MAG: hypothetical protein KY467_16910, partial [Gemmatimonadetes bacterium]|nr:hypothetical protein [Gemmatimonadota bacterium]
AGPSAGIPALPADDAAADEAEAGPSAGIPALPADDAANDEAAAPPEAPPEPAQTPPAAPPAGAEAAAPPPSARKRAGWLVGVGLLAAVLLVGFWMGAGRPPDPVRHGETVRQRGDGGVYLAFAETLYAYPDSATLRACTGVRTPAVREVRRLPAWPRRRLPSVREHAWMGGTVPVVSDHPATRPAYVAVGCILARVPDPPTLDSIFGPGALERMTEAPDPVLRAMPRAFIARGHPVRRAGTLVRGPDGGMRWVTYHGGALAVADSGMLARWCRTPREAVDVSAAEYGYYRPFGWLPARRGECRRRGE